MKIKFMSIGRVNEEYVRTGIDDFTKRLQHYYPVEWTFIAPLKHAGKLSDSDLKKQEGVAVLDLIKKDDYLVLLDERGRQLNSEGLAALLQARANASTKSLVFLIGGAFGVDDAVLTRADFTWSLSALVFPHQLVRLILAEQVYRACTINRNEKYHHS